MKNIVNTEGHAGLIRKFADSVIDGFARKRQRNKQKKVVKVF